MNNLRMIYLFLAVFGFVAGCRKEMPTLENVKNGMTYNEIESLFGKPTSIDKGFPHIEMIENPEYKKLFSRANNNGDLYLMRQLRRYITALNDTIESDPRIKSEMPKLEIKGEDIYTRWSYLRPEIINIRVDTTFVAIPDWNTIQVVRNQETYKYFRRNINYAKETNDHVWEEIDKVNYDECIKLTSTYECMKKNVGIQNVPISQLALVPRIVRYKITSVLSILFETQTGRVVHYGYYPVLSVRIDS